ncbi:MAG: hypothetical protein IAE67_08675 [Candidatus Competibacteraceae bacterium]|nr:hypothetical protein [Candidatus Competibacteraceae bacterium]
MKEDFYHMDQLERLMETKTFNELTDQEKEFVHMHIVSESEYNDMRNVLLQVKQVLTYEREQVHAPVSLKESLIDKFNDANPSVGMRRPNRQIGRWVYYVAASVLLLLSVWVVYEQWPEKNAPHLALHERENPVNHEIPVAPEHNEVVTMDAEELQLKSKDAELVSGEATHTTVSGMSDLEVTVRDETEFAYREDIDDVTTATNALPDYSTPILEESNKGESEKKSKKLGQGVAPSSNTKSDKDATLSVAEQSADKHLIRQQFIYTDL